MMRKNERIVFNSVKLSAYPPVASFRRIIFRLQWSLPLALIVWELRPP